MNIAIVLLHKTISLRVLSWNEAGTRKKHWPFTPFIITYYSLSVLYYFMGYKKKQLAFNHGYSILVVEGWILVDIFEVQGW